MRFIFPDEYFKHIENKESVYAALDDFFDSDVMTDEEFSEKKARVLEVLKDEPEILDLISDDLER